MSFYKFTDDDLFTNTIKAYPEYSFYVKDDVVLVNNEPIQSGAFLSNIYGVPDGYVSLYEYNIDRPTGQRIYPFMYKDGLMNTFKNYSTASYREAQMGAVITSSYNMSSSITRYYYAAVSSGSTRRKLYTLQNTLNYYKYISPYYAYSSSFSNKNSLNTNFISIPSILYGSTIKKGSVSLKFYISGTMLAELQDTRYNGDLIQVSGTTGYASANDGKVAGSILYKEGFIILTGSWDLAKGAYDFLGSGSSNYVTSSWIHFGAGANDGISRDADFGSASFSIDYQGTQTIQTMTMLAHADPAQLNYSNNPTFLTYDQSSYRGAMTGNYQFAERSTVLSNNVDSSFTDVVPQFEQITYISKVGIYDDNRNLIGVAKLATPVKKTIKNNYTFKLKLDI